MKIFSVALLLVGACLPIAFRHQYRQAFPPAGVAQVLLLALALVFSYLAPTRRVIARAIERIRNPSRRVRIVTSIALAIISFAYLYGSAVLHDRDLSPRMQDEFSYIIQSQLLSRGRLWLPQPALADFFETFHVLVKPVYASVYFPGTAMLHVPGVWAGVPHYFTSLAVCAIAVVLIYLLALEFLDGAYALLAAFMLLGTSMFSFNSTLALSNIPAMVFAMAVWIAWLRWRNAQTGSGRMTWAAILGTTAGWGMIIRPLDILPYLIPLALVAACDLRGSKGRNDECPRKRDAGVAFIVAVAFALPFLVLQLVFNEGVTGSIARTPYQLYFDQFQPNTSFGFAQDDPDVKPRTGLQQKVDLYENFLRPMIREHRPSRIFEILMRWRIGFSVSSTMPSDLLLILLPLGISASARKRSPSIVCLLIPSLYLVLYTFYPYFMPYYALAIAPPVILLILHGARAVAMSLSTPRGSAIHVFMLLGITALCLAAVPEVRLDFAKEDDAIPGLNGMNQAIDQRIAAPAVILFRYGPPASPHNEPVYNYTVADPMDAGVLRAQDLGPQRDREIVDYFAAHRPETVFYRFDRASEVMEKLGTAATLSAREPRGAVTPASTQSGARGP